MVFFGGFSPLGGAWVTHWCPTTIPNVSCCRRGSTFNHAWRPDSKKDRFDCAKPKKNRPRNVTISFEPFDLSNTFSTIKNRMGSDFQFFRHPTHRLWWVSLHQGPQILVFYISSNSLPNVVQILSPCTLQTKLLQNSSKTYSKSLQTSSTSLSKTLWKHHINQPLINLCRSKDS